MAYSPIPSTKATYEAAAQWKDKCLLGNGSILQPGLSLWTSDLLDEFRVRFVDNTLEDNRTFLEKLEVQLAPGNADLKRLAAEMLWVLHLFPNNLLPETKRSQITTVWDWSGTPLAADTPALGGLDHGIGNPGQGFNTRRWKELGFLWRVASTFKGEPVDRQTSLLSSPWNFAAFLDGLQDAGVTMMRHILLHLLFPDTFENTGSSKQKKLMAEKLGKDEDEALAPEPSATLSAAARVDLQVLRVRRRMEQTTADTKVNFYDPETRPLWDNQAATVAEEQDPWWQKFFESEDQADETFDFLREVMIACGTTDSQGKNAQRISFTYIKQHKIVSMYVYCGKLKVFSLADRSVGNERCKIISPNGCTANELFTEPFVFTDEKFELSHNVFRLEEILSLSVEERACILNVIKGIVQAHEPIDFRINENAHRPRLLAAVFHPEKRPAFFEQGPKRGPEEIIESGYWWLTANPSVWDPTKMAPGQTHMFKALNENEKPRKMKSAFQAASEGDPVLVYASSPKRMIVAIGSITKSMAATDGVGIEVGFDIICQTPLTVEAMKKLPGISDITPLKQPQGTLFPLTEAEFNTIRAAIPGPPKPSPEKEIYTTAHAMADLFMEESKLLSITALLKRKKNIILQGAPGTGKTFVARRLAYLLMGMKDASRAPITQFHQSTSYEDFIQGYRPDGNGGFELKDGIFHTFCRNALKRPDDAHVFIIDEINRGNLAKILGELMMLIEPDKRSADFAVPLTYAKSQDETFHVPPNVHIIGTMNTADRSLSLVDYALRRRFAFIEAEPGFESPGFRSYLKGAGAEDKLIDTIIRMMGELNAMIAADHNNLGRGYRIGHSFFVPADGITPDEIWLEDVLQHEIRPLLEEYWVDSDKDLQKARTLLG